MTDNNAFNDNNINDFMNNDTGNPNQPIWSPDDNNTLFNPNQSYYNANNASNNAYNNSVINYNDMSNASNNAYNANIINNSSYNNYNQNNNPSYYNAINANASTIREPKSFNREQFQSKLTEQDNKNLKHSSKLVKIITILPFIFFIGIFVIITLSGFQIEQF